MLFGARNPPRRGMHAYRVNGYDWTPSRTPSRASLFEIERPAALLFALGFTVLLCTIMYIARRRSADRVDQASITVLEIS